MKRILVLLSVVALMVVTVAPAFAAKPDFHPTPNINGSPHAEHNPSGEVRLCAVDPTCLNQDVGQSHHDAFPKGQGIAFGD